MFRPKFDHLILFLPLIASPLLEPTAPRKKVGWLVGWGRQYVGGIRLHATLRRAMKTSRGSSTCMALACLHGTPILTTQITVALCCPLLPAQDQLQRQYGGRGRRTPLRRECWLSGVVRGRVGKDDMSSRNGGDNGMHRAAIPLLRMTIQDLNFDPC
jgi:hypothetical protein